ncbi:hypothetical protein Halhy_3626 [Haliscomenobacter hydrossis DSM 1100]|uniref:Uncharacterized protein n=1 Tax=Haliscomenobacter hydrossis (strain ATCC 27775 / DSM 1100 / LMG 10767 / O) TaxID=760192 RepID=F4KYT6_HALH1|nr:hypothetical protein Halhy_3626 [Haliscomenobacter hydrossis DSM 1100]
MIVPYAVDVFVQFFIELGFDEEWLRDFSGHNATAGRGRTCASGSIVFLVVSEAWSSKVGKDQLVQTLYINNIFPIPFKGSPVDIRVKPSAP